jgi:hypothetical protein
LKKEFSDENIEFWSRCEEFKKLSDNALIKDECMQIWNDFLETTSSCQINVDNKTRNCIKQNLHNPDKKIFETAQSQVCKIFIKSKKKPNYLEGDIYKIY